MERGNEESENISLSLVVNVSNSNLNKDDYDWGHFWLESRSHRIQIILIFVLFIINGTMIVSDKSGRVEVEKWKEINFKSPNAIPFLSMTSDEVAVRTENGLFYDNGIPFPKTMETIGLLGLERNLTVPKMILNRIQSDETMKLVSNAYLKSVSVSGIYLYGDEISWVGENIVLKSVKGSLKVSHEKGIYFEIDNLRAINNGVSGNDSTVGRKEHNQKHTRLCSCKNGHLFGMEFPDGDFWTTMNVTSESIGCEYAMTPPCD